VSAPHRKAGSSTAPDVSQAKPPAPLGMTKENDKVWQNDNFVYTS
jgi:hypothetical protein